MMDSQRGKCEYNRGALTVEATLLLPIVFISWLIIINFLNIFFVHICVQQALNNTAKRLSTYAYFVERTGKTADVANVFSLDDNTLKKAGGIYDGVTGAIKSAEDFQSGVTSLQDDLKAVASSGQTAMQNTNQVFNDLTSGNGSAEAVTGHLNAMTDSARELVRNLQNIKLSRLQETIIRPAKEFGKNIKETYEVLKTVNFDNMKDYFLKELANAGGGILIGGFVNLYLKDLNVDLKNVSTLNYSKSQFFYGAKKNTFAIVVTYKYHNPFGNWFFTDIDMQQVAAMNMWIGDESKDLKKLATGAAGE